MAKRWLTQRSITLESEVVNIKVANSSSFMINGSPVVIPTEDVENVASVPTLNAGTILTSHPVNPLYTARRINKTKTLYLQAFVIDTHTGGSNQIAYNQTSLLPLSFRPLTDIWFTITGLDNNTPTTLILIISTLGVAFIAKPDFSVFTGVFGIPEGQCVTWNI